MPWRGETEDGIGWGGLVASKAELREEARLAALGKDAQRYRKLRHASTNERSRLVHLAMAELDAALDAMPVVRAAKALEE